MNAPENGECRRCGAAIPAGATDALCPACLLSGALESPAGLDETVAVAPEGGRRPAPRDPEEFPFEFGGYRLLGVLGSGGMGTVYEAEQLDTGRRVALKMLEQRLDSPEMRHRFLREGRLAASVNHPNSLYVYGSEEIEGTPVITMEVAAGGTLKDELDKRGPLPVPEAVDAILDVVDGLESAFAAGVLHRDVKPSNCFVGPDGAVKVGDFGLSVSTQAGDDTYATASGVIMGTPAYAPPEQLRGDDVDERADIYSVGATLFTLLSGRAPFEGRNAVQVVTHVMTQEPNGLRELREEVPPALERVVTRCLAKEPAWRYDDYMSLRNALLPFSSREPEPASMLVRSAAGWVDFLIAFLPAYVALMLTVGGEELLVRPLVERTLGSARHYLLLFAVGFLYFGIAEGLAGAGVGKRLKGLRVVRRDGRRPGFWRALLRIAIPIACVEGVRMPVSAAFISSYQWSGVQTAAFVVAAIVCGWAPALLMLRARRENGFATFWDSVTGTRVVVAPKGAVRPRVGEMAGADPRVAASEVAGAGEVARAGGGAEASDGAGTEALGPFLAIGSVEAGRWVEAFDPVLRRRLWLRRREGDGPSPARRNVARPGRLRWLQEVRMPDEVWDAYEAPSGAPLVRLHGSAATARWGALRHWLHDLARELWDATRDGTLPDELSLDHAWITTEGRAVLLDEGWPDVETPAERGPARDMAEQQRFLSRVAACSEATSLPRHVRPVLRNLADGKFEKLSFLAGTLRGLLDPPAEVSGRLRAGALFVIPLYAWVAFFVGRYHDKAWTDAVGATVLGSALVILGCAALVQLLEIPFRTTVGHTVFRLAVVDARGELASRGRLLARWAFAWLPLLVPMAFVARSLAAGGAGVAAGGLTLLVLWLGAVAFAVVSPHRGLHDRWAGTWVVRR